MSKHTPGPWKVEETVVPAESKPRLNSPYHVVRGENFDEVAWLPAWDEYWDKGKNQANVNLIVAAPEMHSALEECYSFLKRFAEVVMETKNSLLLDYFREFDGLPTRIKEVLDKIKGEVK